MLETLSAIGDVGGDHAIGEVAKVMRCRSWLARKKMRAVKETSISTLGRIASPAAGRALADAAETGDRLLKRLARAAIEIRPGSGVHG